MSDNATLERWGLPTADRIAQRVTDGYWTPWHIAATRIAELEAEVARLVEANAYVNDANARLAGVRDVRIAELEASLGEAMGRIETDGRLIAELEAERDQWKGEAHRLRNVIANKNAEQDRLEFALEAIRAGETTDPAEMADAALRGAS